MFGRFYYQNLPDFVKQTVFLLFPSVLIKDGQKLCSDIGGCLQMGKDSNVLPRSQGSILRAHTGQWGTHTLLSLGTTAVKVPCADPEHPGG